MTETTQAGFNSVDEQLEALGICPEHSQSVTTINKYFEDHRIN